MSLRRAFSLIELLFAVFILAIGVISVSALFPAGILQQQQSADEQLGPQIADHALGLIRARVSSADFGCFEDFGIGGAPANAQARLFTKSVQNGSYVFRGVPGDWSWMRPGVVRLDQVGTVGVNLRGALDVFSALAQQDGGTDREFCELPQGVVSSVPGITLFGIPYQFTKSLRAPPVIITQRERWWPTIPEPSATASAATDQGLLARNPPAYAWECMFRRHGGTIQVGIFVFRYVAGGGARRPFYAAPVDGGQPAFPARLTGGYGNLPGFPYRRVLAASGTGLTSGSATTGPQIGLQVPLGWQQPAVDSAQGRTPFTTGTLIAGASTVAGGPGQGLGIDDFPADGPPPIHHQWQFSGQWLIDNNGNVHRVNRGRRSRLDQQQVWLQAPIPRVEPSAVYDDYELIPAAGTDPVPFGVRTLHYVPSIVDEEGGQLIPIYATVRNL